MNGGSPGSHDNYYSSGRNFPFAAVHSIRISAAFFTILATAWLCTLGVVWAVIGLLFAKHILVAILLMHVGIDRDARGLEQEIHAPELD